MRREQIQKIRNAVNPRFIRSILMDLSVYHRETTSNGMINAAKAAAEIMKKAGLETDLYTFRNDEDYYSTPAAIPFNFWEAKAGWCEVVGEEGHRIADFLADPICILGNSVSCDHRNDPVEVVIMDRGPEEEKYADVDFTGKIIFIKDGLGGHYFRASTYTRWAVGKRGAIGHISSAVAIEENVRGPWNQYDTIAWNGTYKGSFGFGITPREGDRLAKLYYEKQARGEKLMVRCYIDSTTEGPNEMSNAEAIIRGTTDEEVILFAHLCHPRPSTNDNLSGCSAVISAMYALNELISRGILPAPKRTIRGIVGPEMIGSVAEIIRKNRPRKTRAVFNMDMVGAQQGPMGVGPVFLSDAPRSTPNCVNDIASFCMEEICKDNKNYGVEWVCMHNMTETTYSPGSDQDIWNDPESGAPCAYLGQWPDRFYHSSSDDITTMDPTLIAKSAGITAAGAYLLATLEPDDLPQYMAKGVENITRTIVRDMNPGDEAHYGMVINHYREYYRACCDHYISFFDDPEDKEKATGLAAEQKKRVDTLIGVIADTVCGHHIEIDDYPSDGRDLDAKYQFIPVKNFIGRTYDFSEYAKRVENGTQILEEFDKKYDHFNFNRCHMLSLFYADGKRTFAECVTRACIDRKVTDREKMAEALFDFFTMFEKLGAVTFHEAPAAK